ncbi:uncharacterized protein [Oryza sativa Japonica Group]|uniref:Os07g0516700 protein n=3 Tax=Oryza TaxID=4527 RepID=A0A0P0X717_ORYSJ|nr:uncharacterized protein LOC9268153 [Oryza sativa Japonica Group]EAZ40016.1 hypothetical protein OsJ_24454 [Oryza sativa Japonica Group]KAF2923056.1 hypothetical protein DAI22_07g162100 [Oryza sativa Japonica Group]BAC83712.1 hypothetical protein [Oryza sativa Japonica Group]BAD31316.1 hypothetical protein [Oryza sativa Japonica Group]BAH93951.1 Os07g0516700 [Oryza sativa Japonica Group]|eukprot:NP_001175223.1 Os07g0516700 [Oryza sativa Japonica Group]
MMMLLLRPSAAAAAAPFAYAKVDKVDAEEARHLQAQYLIHKVLEGSSAARGRGRGRRPAARQVGVRLRRLRLAARSVRLRLCRGLQRHLRSLRRLVRGSSALHDSSSCS